MPLSPCPLEPPGSQRPHDTCLKHPGSEGGRRPGEGTVRDGALEPPGGAGGGCDLRHSGHPCSSPLPRPRTGLSPAAVHAGPGVGGHREGVSPSQPDLRQKRRRRRKTGFPRQGPAPRGGRLRGQAASGTGGFGDRRLWDRRLWGAGRLAAGMLRLCRCLVSTNPRAAGGLGPQPLWPQSPRLSAEG